MASNRKSFVGTKKTAAEKKPIEFDIVGESLKALPNVSGIVTIEYLEGLNSENSRDQLHAVKQYLQESFDDENREKFNKIIRDTSNDIDLDVLMEIMSWLVEQRASRPLED